MISNSPQKYVLFFLHPTCASIRWSSVVAKEEGGVDLLVVLALRILKIPAVSSGKFWRAVTVSYLLFLYLTCYQAGACAHTRHPPSSSSLRLLGRVCGIEFASICSNGMD